MPPSVGAIVIFTLRSSPGTPSAPIAAATGEQVDKPPATHVTLLYATEEKEWLQAAIAEYGTQHPEVEVELVGKGSLDAAQVFVVWEDRAQALMGKAGTSLGFRAIHDAVASTRGWPAVGGKAEWGFVKLGHTDPTRSNSGLQTLLLMTLEYWNKRDGLAIADLLDPAYQTFVRETERGVNRFESSTGTFMQDMVRFGPSKYDISVVYENLAIEQIENAQGRWGNLKVYYPATTLWSDHPVALLNAPWVTPAQRTAARALIAYLRSHPVQQRALSFGFRPGDPSVPIRTSDAQNPYNRLAQFGLRVEVPPVATVPEGAVIRNLMMMWSRVARPQ